MKREEKIVWEEYDSICEWMAKRGLRGIETDPLPQNIGLDVFELIDEDIEAFQERINQVAYSLACEKEGKI